MKKIGVGFLLAGLCLAGCGSNQAMLAKRGQDEAEHLQGYCKRAGLSGADLGEGDALLAACKRLLKDGDEASSWEASEQAQIHYRLALALREQSQGQARVDALKQHLAKDQDQLRTYQEVLQEMKSRSKP